MEEHEEGVAMGKEGDIIQPLQDETKNKAVEERRNLQQFRYRELLLLNKDLIIIEDSARN